MHATPYRNLHFCIAFEDVQPLMARKYPTWTTRNAYLTFQLSLRGLKARKCPFARSFDQGGNIVLSQMSFFIANYMASCLRRIYCPVNWNRSTCIVRRILQHCAIDHGDFHRTLPPQRRFSLLFQRCKLDKHPDLSHVVNAGLTE